MSNETFEQGWAARPFKEQFPELSDRAAERLDKANMAIFGLFLNDLITDSENTKIRQKRFPKLVSEEVSKARKEQANA